MRRACACGYGAMPHADLSRPQVLGTGAGCEERIGGIYVIPHRPCGSPLTAEAPETSEGRLFRACLTTGPPKPASLAHPHLFQLRLGSVRHCCAPLIREGACSAADAVVAMGRQLVGCCRPARPALGPAPAHAACESAINGPDCRVEELSDLASRIDELPLDGLRQVGKRKRLWEEDRVGDRGSAGRKRLLRIT